MSTREQAKAELTARQDSERARLEERQLAERAALEAQPKDGKPRRVRYLYKIEVPRSEHGDIPRTFVLREETQLQVQDKRHTGGWTIESYTFRDVTAPMTRHQLVEMLGTGTDWLAYLGEDETS